ncbi:MAG: hypothetical protein R3A52_06155 [Polyangiales bacterium]
MKPARKVFTVAMRARSSSRVVSVSGCFGGSWPARRAAAPLAWSHAAWTCRTSAYWSG